MTEEQDLTKIPVQEVEVKTQPTNVKSKIGDEEFVKEFVKLVKGGPDWRSAKTMADKLGVDEVDLARWMDKQQELCRRPGKEEGTVYYALASRLEKPKDEKRPPGMERKVITESDKFMVAVLHTAYDVLYGALEKYGMRAYEIDEEAFKAALMARDRLSAAVVLLAKRLQADLNNLPK